MRNVVAQFIGREEPDKSGNYRRKNPKHEILKENQKAKVKMQNGKATVKNFAFESVILIFYLCFLIFVWICLGFRYSNLEFRCQQLYLVLIGILTKRAWLI